MIMIIKKFLLSGLLAATTSFLWAQKIGDVINPGETERIEKVLSSDDMRGRRIFTPEIDKAADFIATEFKKDGLQTLNNSGSYLQEFTMIQPKFINASGTMDGSAIEEKNIIVVTCQQELKVNENSGYEKAVIGKDADLFSEARKYVHAEKNLLVMVSTDFANDFKRMAGFKRSLFKSDKSVVFILSDKVPTTFSIAARHTISEHKLANVVAVLPGKSKRDEYVIFSAHYDHLGVGQAVNGDSIYNGANDDASGTTAVIMLAKYYKELHNNERTIIFAAFTAEEVGGFGSQYFSRQFDPAKVVAMFNIEMIGTESKWGKNSAYITGFDKTDMGSILQKNLDRTAFIFYPDPYPDQQLFYRSDNATLARLGVPAHTISTSKMDIEPHYHKVSDQIETLDMDNMSRIIQSIALSARSIVDGRNTPARVNTGELN